MRALPFVLSLVSLAMLPGCPGTTASDAGSDVPLIPSDGSGLDTSTDTGGVDSGGLDSGGVDSGGLDAGTDGGLACGTAQNARGEGACDLALGVAWTGSYCASLSGCTCVGADCDSLFTDLEACGEAYRGCPRSCGGLTPTGSPSCLADELCDYPTGSFCGGDDSPGSCRARPTDCPEPGGVPVCGCNGVDYLNECLANLAGTDIVGLGMCTSDGDV